MTRPAAPRVHDIDALRGFALLGIFAVNITFMASAYPANLVDDPAFAAPLDDTARFVVAALFSMKFYLLFSFLFGYSFVFQMEAAQRAGQGFGGRMLRRIGGLFLIGAASLILLGGDILTTYALAALVLLAMHRVRDVVALRTACGIYAVVVTSLVTSALFLDRSAFVPAHDEALVNAAAQTQGMLGPFADIVRGNIDGLGFHAVQAISLQGPTALAMFLLGMVVARRGVLATLTGNEPVLRLIQLIGFPIGLAGGVTYAALGAHADTLATAVSVATAPFLAAAYLATLVRAMHSPRIAWLRSLLAPAGRVALTNYLMQALIGVALFNGIGLGLAGQMSPPLLLAMTVAVFMVQVAASIWWLRSHRYGPAEYLLRWITDWRRPVRR
ncbi:MULTISPECIES: DUF418 domain-containing protein [Actinoalloteichus]|uniref:Membrane protein n=1 Tax=Actinoalloteichus fjordicus TaxID=1612552 RepID=A0AAC9L945_9PSEU|nr:MULTISPECIES: DUF418 domain-containing protein [Actinoalloteichus]APU12115.1 putative membrane protein [Actinoalloteichus fjordicus]APU18067.1 putative membrane protein [Actinoalloteichus sp. GBA129-24]